MSDSFDNVSTDDDIIEKDDEAVADEGRVAAA